MFDPDFSRAFVDGRFYDGIKHEEAFKKTKCPIMLIHADWKRYENFGLIGAFDKDDAKHAISLAPQIIYKKVPANHVIHAFKPKKFIELLTEFKESI